MNIEPLPARLSKNGLFYEQVKRVDQFAILSIRLSPQSPIIGFDLIKVMVREKRAKIDGVIVNTGILMEWLPSSEEWGRFGWSFSTLAAAENALINKGVCSITF